MSNSLSKRSIRRFLPALVLASACCGLIAQSDSPFSGSVAQGEAAAQPIALTLDDAIQRGLKANLGIILGNAQTAAARGEQLRVCFDNKTSSETLNASPQTEQLESCARSAQKTDMLLKGP